jgi:hypothetical protein
VWNDPGLPPGLTYRTRQITEGKTSATKTDTLKVPKASLLRGDRVRPQALMIPGAPADAGGFAALVQHSRRPLHGGEP